MGSATDDIAQAAARLVVDDGLEYGAAKRKAARDLSRRQGRRTELPSNEAIEDEVRDYLSLFQADTQPRELLALRRLALHWMERLQAFRPHLTGAVWRGTATRRSAVQIELYCDDPKAAEIALIDQRVDFDPVGQPDGPDLLRVDVRCAELGESAAIFLHILDRDDLRGGLKPDARGRTWRGDTPALQRLLQSDAS
jgi:Ni,Fe-hydrogenase III large subunit